MKLSIFERTNYTPDRTKEGGQKLPEIGSPLTPNLKERQVLDDLRIPKTLLYAVLNQTEHQLNTAKPSHQEVKDLTFDTWNHRVSLAFPYTLKIQAILQSNNGILQFLTVRSAVVSPNTWKYCKAHNIHGHMHASFQSGEVDYCELAMERLKNFQGTSVSINPLVASRSEQSPSCATPLILLSHILIRAAIRDFPYFFESLPTTSYITDISTGKSEGTHSKLSTNWTTRRALELGYIPLPLHSGMFTYRYQ